MSVADGVGTGAAVRPAWRRLRLWVALAVLLLVAAVLGTTITGGPAGALDPRSETATGSRALAVLLDGYGTGVRRTTSLTEAADAGGTVLVTAPDAYDAGDLRKLRAAAARLVLVAPSQEALDLLSAPAFPYGPTGGLTDPACSWPGARAAGPVDLPPGTTVYEVPGGSGDAEACYGGAVVVAPTLVVLGSAGLLHNHTLADTGVAALDVNAITADRTVDRVTWLLPGTEATGQAAPTYWDLFPTGARRAFLWTLLLGVLLALWRGRRFGPVVSEPLPVVVRAAEVVEGHGRLYRRAGARDRAASALRAAAAERLRARLGLQRGATPAELVAALAPVTGRDPATLAALLAGPPPADEAGLIRLAAELDRLEAAAGVPRRGKDTHP